MLKMKEPPGMCMKTNGQDDNLPDTKDAISTRLHGILYGRYKYFAETVGLLSLFARWGTNPSLQNIAARAKRHPFVEQAWAIWSCHPVRLASRVVETFICGASGD